MAGRAVIFDCFMPTIIAAMLMREIVAVPDKLTLSETYYHGTMERTEVDKHLYRNGDFLLFIPEEDDKPVLTLAVRHGGLVRNFHIGKIGDKYFINGITFASIPSLITYYLGTNRFLADYPYKIAIYRPVPHDEWLISHDRLRIEGEVGRGAYGKVHKGLLQVGSEFITVAIKEYTGSKADKASKQQFMQEARTMHDFNHLNVLKLIGIACQREPLMIVLEFCGGGSLAKCLKTQGPHLGLATRIRFATEASAGMRYLEERKVIHRDVAARNCLLTENELTLKISDFGLTINIERAQTPNYDLKMPTKWLAPETLRDHTFNSKTDVWSFGILLYEIFTDGNDPYPGMTNTEVRKKLTSGNEYRMQIPLEVPPGIEKLIRDCWQENPKKRPTFKEINRRLTKSTF